MAIKLSPRNHNVTFELVRLQAAAAFGSLPFRSEALDISDFSIGSLHIYGSSLSGLQVDVEISNIDRPGLGEIIATNVAANKVVLLNQGAKFVFFNLKQLTSGLVGATFSGRV